MPPNTESVVHNSTLGIKEFPNRKENIKHVDLWLKNKKDQDGAEGLWRVYDNLYDFTDFIKKHPGGEFWLNISHGLDITEAFESHHISTVPEGLLKKYFVRKARTLRNSPFTFKEDGFYKTLKRNVREEICKIPKNAKSTSKMIIDSLLFLVISLSIIANMFQSYLVGFLAGIVLYSVSAAAHNYYHQKDSFRMYYSDIAMIQSREWRILHVLSHHLFPNSVIDMQAYYVEPFLSYFPESKSFLVKYGSWIYTPIFLWPTLEYYMLFQRLFCWIFLDLRDGVTKGDLLPFVLPTAMYVLSQQPILQTIYMWLFISLLSSFWYSLVGLASTHFHPEIFIDGDTPRSEDDMDWGINQLDTVGDRKEITGHHFLAMITFGDHAMHHLFPSMDHSYFQYLYPVVRKTLDQFSLQIRETTQVEIVQGYFQQLSREKPNDKYPSFSNLTN